MRRRIDLACMNREVAALTLPDAVYKTSPWQPRDRFCERAHGRFPHHHPDGAGGGPVDDAVA